MFNAAALTTLLVTLIGVLWLFQALKTSAAGDRRQMKDHANLGVSAIFVIIFAGLGLAAVANGIAFATTGRSILELLGINVFSGQPDAPNPD